MAFKRRTVKDAMSKEDLIKQLVDKPYGEEKKIKRRSITITILTHKIDTEKTRMLFLK